MFDFPSSPTELQLYAPMGGPTYRYVAPGWRVVDSGMASFDPDSKAIFNAFTTPPTPSRKDLIDVCVKSLKASGVWDKLDAFYAFAAADSQAALINWKQPGTYNATLVNAPAFAADSGFLGASTKYVDSNFNPTTATTPKFVQNSATIFGWSATSTAVTGGLVGTSFTGASGETFVIPYYGGSQFLIRVNSTGDVNAGNPGSSAGLSAASRTDASTVISYKNGALLSSQAAASAAMLNSTLRFLQRGTQYYDAVVCGGGFGSSLSAAEHLALYNALNAYLTGLVTYQAETNAIAAAFTTPPTTSRKNLIDAAVVALKTAGVWAKLDALYLFAAADAQAAKINWKAPGTYNCTEVNAPAFTADQGFTGASTKYLDSGFNASTASTPNYTQNSASLFGWALTDVTVNAGMVGYITAQNALVLPRNVGSFFMRVSTSSSAQHVTGASASSVGLWSISRSTSALQTGYKDGVSLGTNAGGSITPPNENHVFLRHSAYWTGQIGVGGIGADLNSTEQTALYNALRTYLTGVGVP